MKKFLKKIWLYKPFRVFVWNTFDAFITLALTLAALTQTSDSMIVLALSPVLYSVINYISKYVNTKWFGDLGVN